MDCRVVGSADRVIARPAPIDAAGPDAVTFYSKGVDGARDRIGGSAASVVVCTPEAASTLEEVGDRTLLLVANPRLAFTRIMRRFFAPPNPKGIHSTAVIHPEATLGNDVYVGPFTYVGKAEIGDGTVIDGHTYVYDRVSIGRRVRIKACSVIGGAGFGFERDALGLPEFFTHVGGVVLEDEVWIGSNCCIDCGALGETRICRGTKLDNQIHVAHNVRIGPGCLLTGGCNLSGSSTLGAEVYVGPSAWISSGVQVGDKAFITGGAVVTRNVESGGHVSGNFAIDHRRFIEFMRSIR